MKLKFSLMYTSKFKIKCPEIFQKRNYFKTVLELHQYGDLSNGIPLEHLICLYKNDTKYYRTESIGFTVQQTFVFKCVVYKIQQIAEQF
jgi:hypothetical protein